MCRHTVDDLRRLLAKGEKIMIGSIDVHWKWRNYPIGWRGQFTRGDIESSTIMLVVVASYDLWTWHAFWGGGIKQ
jgi:hypothetical protein